MSAWITLTVRDLEAARHAELVDAVRRKATSVGQPDPVPVAIAKIVEEIRGCIGFKSPALLDADTATIAPNLVELCVQKVARTLMPRVGRSLTEDERADEKTYQRRLEQLKDGEWPVDLPENSTAATAQTPSSGISVAKSTRRRATRRILESL